VKLKYFEVGFTDDLYLSIYLSNSVCYTTLPFGLSSLKDGTISHRDMHTLLFPGPGKKRQKVPGPPSTDGGGGERDKLSGRPARAENAADVVAGVLLR
jgi:hypothetical protein